MKDSIINDFISSLTMPDAMQRRAWKPQGMPFTDEYNKFASIGGQGYTPDGLFHFFGVSTLLGHDFNQWNSISVWRRLMLKDLKWYAVAEDAFGYQFCMRCDGSRPVVKALSLWDGSFTLVANTFSDFITSIVLNNSSWKSMRDRYAQIIKRDGMAFRPLAHLTFSVPPILGIIGQDENAFEWVDSVTNASLLSQVFANANGPQV